MNIVSLDGWGASFWNFNELTMSIVSSGTDVYLRLPKLVECLRNVLLVSFLTFPRVQLWRELKFDGVGCFMPLVTFSSISSQFDSHYLIMQIRRQF